MNRIEALVMVLESRDVAETLDSMAEAVRVMRSKVADLSQTDMANVRQAYAAAMVPGSSPVVVTLGRGRR